MSEIASLSPCQPPRKPMREHLVDVVCCTYLAVVGGPVSNTDGGDDEAPFFFSWSSFLLFPVDMAAKVKSFNLSKFFCAMKPVALFLWYYGSSTRERGTGTASADVLCVVSSSIASVHRTGGWI